MLIQFDTPKGRFEIRELSSQVEMVAAEQIQLKVWGTDIFPHPKELLIPVQHEGGLLAGAFEVASQEMVGLVFSFPTRDSHVQHSQMLATLEGWRGVGIGTRLKWFQRDWCLERGIYSVRWTVDPLRAANAILNISHLGATAGAYTVDYYGKMQGIDAGAPTDRLLVEWHLDSPRVMDRLAGVKCDGQFPDAGHAIEMAGDRPGKLSLDLASRQVCVRIPSDYIRICQADAQLALDWRLKTRVVFQSYFLRGYRIMEFTRSSGPAYILEKGS